MAKIAPRPEIVQVGKYRATPRQAGETWSWEITGPGKHGSYAHVANVPDSQFQKSGRRMLECYDQGKPFVPTEEFAGEQLDVAVAENRRRELLEKGRDHTLQVSEFERYLATHELDGDGMFAEAVGRYPAQQWPGFERELFATLYGAPQPVENPHASDGWMGKLLELAGETTEWEQLRAQCKNDPWAAGLGAARITTALAKEIGEELKKLPKVDPVELEEEAKLREELKPGSGEAHQDAAEISNAMAMGMLDALSGKAETKIRAIVRRAADKVGDEIEGMAVALAGLGAGSLPGAASKVSAPREELRALLANNPKLRKIAAIAGRLKMRARAKQRTKVNYQPEQVVDVTTGGELNRLVPSEVMLLGDETAELMLMAKLLERRALQYRLEGREQADQGPVILAVDNSGSMLLPNDPNLPNRHEWAMGVALALLEVCAKQRRAFCLVHFDSIVQKTFEVEKPASLDLGKLIEMVSFFSNGGTSFAPPLEWAKRRIEKAGTFGKSDVILVTDGQGSWGSKVQELKAIGACVYGVAIDDDFSAEQRAELAGAAHIKDLSPKNEGAIELVFGI
jgi:uncharacterized protein with von Willebrand factor type A (vWA) domain